MVDAQYDASPANAVSSSSSQSFDATFVLPLTRKRVLNVRDFDDVDDDVVSVETRVELAVDGPALDALVESAAGVDDQVKLLPSAVMGSRFDEKRA